MRMTTERIAAEKAICEYHRDLGCPYVACNSCEVVAPLFADIEDLKKLLAEAVAACRMVVDCRGLMASDACQAVVERSER